MNIKSQIGNIVHVLYHNIHGKILVKNKLKSKIWWQNELNNNINSPTITILNNTNPGIYNKDGELQQNPIPFEKEMNLDENLSDYWITYLKVALKNIHEYKTIT